MSKIPTVDLPQGIVLMDGGMGQELRRRGLKGSNILWSAYALVTAPQIVGDIHRDYINAGAQIITTNTYSTIRRRLDDAAIGSSFEKLNVTAGNLAASARDECGKDVLIAGSLPPLQGSYRPDLVEEFDITEPFYREQAEILAPYVDFFLCETMSSSTEARAAASGAASTGKPVWVSWTLRDGGSNLLRSGETISQAHGALKDIPVSGFLANCSSPESITQAMDDLKNLGDFPVGGYANAFAGIPKNWSLTNDAAMPGVREDLTPQAYGEHAMRWIASGARIVGGCCEVGPEHIAHLHNIVR
jgi:S-methylmethionine-dependent homocysteine/selenocysteine methylase